jgi:hypothetical protein
MNAGAARAKQPGLDATAAWCAVEAHRITLIPILDGRMWHASVERVKKARKWGRDEMEVISATASFSMDAVAKLVKKLNKEAAQRDLWKEAA